MCKHTHTHKNTLTQTYTHIYKDNLHALVIRQGKGQPSKTETFQQYLQLITIGKSKTEKLSLCIHWFLERLSAQSRLPSEPGCNKSSQPPPLHHHCHCQGGIREAQAVSQDFYALQVVTSLLPRSINKNHQWNTYKKFLFLQQSDTSGGPVLSSAPLLTQQ